MRIAWQKALALDNCAPSDAASRLQNFAVGIASTSSGFVFFSGRSWLQNQGPVAPAADAQALVCGNHPIILSLACLGRKLHSHASRLTSVAAFAVRHQSPDPIPSRCAVENCCRVATTGLRLKDAKQRREGGLTFKKQKEVLKGMIRAQGCIIVNRPQFSQNI